MGSSAQPHAVCTSGSSLWLLWYAGMLRLVWPRACQQTGAQALCVGWRRAAVFSCMPFDSPRAVDGPCEAGQGRPLGKDCPGVRYQFVVQIGAAHFYFYGTDSTTLDSSCPS